jgi:dipeptidyl aminopeptidase/acylaminoacyl peptidase
MLRQFCLEFLCAFFLNAGLSTKMFPRFKRFGQMKFCYINTKLRFAVLFFAFMHVAATVAAEPVDSDFVVPGGNVVCEGIPRISARLADAVRPYTEFRGAMFCDWHPTRRSILIGTNFADTMQLHEVKRPGGARTQLTFFKEPVWEANFEPIRGNYFVFARDRGGNENYQKFRFDIEAGAVPTGRVTRITDGASRNTFRIWSNGGDLFAYASTRRNRDDVDLWIMNPKNQKSDRLLARLEGGGWEPLDFSPDDRQLLAINRVSINEAYLWIVKISTGEKTLITPKSGTNVVAYGAAQYSRDGNRLYVTTDRDSEFLRLAAISLSDKKHTYLTSSINWDITDFRLSWDGKTIAFVANEDGNSVLRLLDATTGNELAKPKIPIGQIGGLRWNRNNSDVGFTFLDARRGADVYSFDIKASHLERWTFSETGGIKTDGIKMPELIRWRSFDDRAISGWLYRPPSRFTGRRPVIVQIHGGPEGQARPWLSAGSSYLVNELGIVLIQPNVRGSSGYGKTFLTLDNGFKREDSYKDIGSLFDWIKTQDDLNADRIMVTGGSYGGFMTLAVATNYADRIRCALDIVGPSNLATFLQHTSGYRRDLRRVEYGDERDPKMLEFLNRIAPLTNAARITKPLFVVQGGNDPRVPLSESEQIVKTVRKNGVPVWYLMAKDEGHGFQKKSNEDFLLYATVMFVQKYLLN